MLQRALNQCFRSGMPKLFQKLCVKTPAINTDPDGDPAIPAYIHNRFNPVISANVAGVDPNL